MLFILGSAAGKHTAAQLNSQTNSMNVFHQRDPVMSCDNVGQKCPGTGGDTRCHRCMYAYLNASRIYESQLKLGFERHAVAFELITE